MFDHGVINKLMKKTISRLCLGFFLLYGMQSCQKSSSGNSGAASGKGMVTTVAGNGVSGYKDGSDSTAEFTAPWGVAVDNQNNIYVADYSNNMIRKISLTGYIISPSLPLGLIFNGTTGTISGTPKQTLAATNYTITAYNASGSSTTTISIEVRQPGALFMANSLQEMPIETGEPNVKKVLSPNGGETWAAGVLRRWPCRFRA